MGGEWTQTEHLLAGVFDVLNWANYQRAGCNGSKPKPLERPAPKKKPASRGRMTLTQAREKEARRQELLREKVE